jgi:hypothetical protein
MPCIAASSSLRRWGSAAFFLQSHLHARIAAKASTLHAAKAVCLLLVAVHIVCLGAVIAFGTAMAYELLVAFMGYMQVLLRFAPVFIEAILGIRMAEG